MTTQNIMQQLSQLSSEGYFNLEKIRGSSQEKLEELLQGLDEKIDRGLLENEIRNKKDGLNEGEVYIAAEYYVFDFSIVKRLMDQYIEYGDQEPGLKKSYYEKAVQMCKRAVSDKGLLARATLKQVNGAIACKLIQEGYDFIGREVALQFCVEYNLPYDKVYPTVLGALRSASRHDEIMGRHYTEELNALIGPDAKGRTLEFPSLPKHQEY